MKVLELYFWIPYWENFWLKVIESVNFDYINQYSSRDYHMSNRNSDWYEQNLMVRSFLTRFVFNAYTLFRNKFRFVYIKKCRKWPITSFFAYFTSINLLKFLMCYIQILQTVSSTKKFQSMYYDTSKRKKRVIFCWIV